MLHVKDLIQKERRIRKTFSSEIGEIIVYDPGAKEYELLNELLEKEIQQKDKKVEELDEGMIVALFFPLLTSINFDNTSDEDLFDLIDNPPMIIKQIAIEVAAILYEIKIISLQEEKLKALEYQMEIEGKILAIRTNNVMETMNEFNNLVVNKIEKKSDELKDGLKPKADEKDVHKPLVLNKDFKS